jgi:hypothetical protein
VALDFVLCSCLALLRSGFDLIRPGHLRALAISVALCSADIGELILILRGRGSRFHFFLATLPRVFLSSFQPLHAAQLTGHLRLLLMDEFGRSLLGFAGCLHLSSDLFRPSGFVPCSLSIVDEALSLCKMPGLSGYMDNPADWRHEILA